MTSFVPQLGESFIGRGVNAAHVNTVLGLREGPVGVAWATALATPSAGHAPFVAVLQPGLPVKPFTLFVNKAAIAGDRHGELTWGAAQAGIASGVARAAEEDIVSRALLDELVLIAAVWVNPQADADDVVFDNNREATFRSLSAGADNGPPTDDVLAASDDAWNPYFRAR
jgi:5,6,7,8-tetrahydromethanopterin hydro-lyase